MNYVFLIGNLSKAPEMAETTNGVTVCNLSIAVNKPFDRENADFFRVTTFKGVAENCGRYLTKGSKVAVVGFLQNRSYDKNGEKHYTTDIIAKEIEFLNRADTAQTTERKPSLEPVEDLPF